MIFSKRTISFLKHLKMIQEQKYFTYHLSFKQNIFHPFLFVVINTNKGFIDLSKISEIEVEDLIHENILWDKIIIKNTISGNKIAITEMIETFMDENNDLFITTMANNNSLSVHSISLDIAC